MFVFEKQLLTKKVNDNKYRRGVLNEIIIHSDDGLSM